MPGRKKGMNMRTKLLFALTISLLFLLSCRPEQTGDMTSLKVSFSDYKKDAYRVYLSDKEGNDFEEMRDTVRMTVSSDGAWKGKSYLIQLDENPVRKQFQTPGAEYNVAIDKKDLAAFESATPPDYIYSDKISFR